MGTCLLKGSVDHPWMAAFLRHLVRWAIREDIPEPQPVPSQLPPRLEMTRVLMMTCTGGCAIENYLEVQILVVFVGDD